MCFLARETGYRGDAADDDGYVLFGCPAGVGELGNGAGERRALRC